MEFVNLVTNVGFPIACTIGLGYFVKYMYDKLQTDHENQIKNLNDIISKQQEINASFIEILNDIKEQLTNKGD